MRPFLPMRRSAGFSLLEVFLALGIALALSGLALERLKHDNENAQAQAVGQQIGLAGQALNQYIAMRVSQIVTGTSVAAGGDVNDPGPRTCAAASSPYTYWCWITSDTLRQNGLIPLSFTGQNAYGASYNYIIRVSGTAPLWNVDGIVLTNAPYLTGGTNPRYDLLGQAMMAAGADAGMTRSNATTFEGLDGGWTDADFGTFMNDMATSPGQQVVQGLLGVRAGYGTSGYAAYLRQDGGNAMTGDLNLGTHNITNATAVTATGVIQGAQLVGTGAAGGANLLLGSTSDNTAFQHGGGALTIRNTGGLTLSSTSNNLLPISVGQVLLGTGTSTTTGLAASGSTVVVAGDGSFSTTGTGSSAGNITSAGTLNSVGNATIGGQIQIQGSATAGAACSGSGKVANGGELLQCKNSVWTKLGVGDTTLVNGLAASAGYASVATCPSGSHVVAGGYNLTKGIGMYPPTTSVPAGSGATSWTITVNANEPAANKWQAVALCSSS